MIESLAIFPVGLVSYNYLLEVLFNHIKKYFTTSRLINLNIGLNECFWLYHNTQFWQSCISTASAIKNIYTYEGYSYLLEALIIFLF